MRLFSFFVITVVIMHFQSAHEVNSNQNSKIMLIFLSTPLKSFTVPFKCLFPLIFKDLFFISSTVCLIFFFLHNPHFFFFLHLFLNFRFIIHQFTSKLKVSHSSVSSMSKAVILLYVDRCYIVLLSISCHWMHPFSSDKYVLDNRGFFVNVNYYFLFPQWNWMKLDSSLCESASITLKQKVNASVKGSFLLFLPF